MPSGDGTRIYQPPAGGGVTTVDTWEIDLGSGDLRDREITRLGGDGIDDLAEVLAAAPPAAALGLVVRGVDAATETTLESLRADVANGVAVTGPLTDTQLRATAVPVSGTVATGGLTDTELRATAVPVSGFPASQAVTGPLTDTQLRATAVPISGTITANLGTIDGASTEATLALVKTNLDTLLARVPDLTGTWSYEAATLTGGSLSATGVLAVLRVFASGTDGTFTLNGGDTITVRSGTGFDLGADSQVTNPVVAWVSGTLDVFCAVLA